MGDRRVRDSLLLCLFACRRRQRNFYSGFNIELLRDDLLDLRESFGFPGFDNLAAFDGPEFDLVVFGTAVAREDEPFVP